MKDWEYSNLSHRASLAGGPEALLEQQFNKGFDAGLKAKRPDQIIVVLAGVVVGYAIRCITDHFVTELRKPKIDSADVRALEDAIEEEEKIEEEYALEELKDRFEDLKEMDAACMDIVTQYVDLFGLSEDDSSIIRTVKDQSDYPEYAERFLKVMPDAEELDVVRAYIEWVRQFEGEDVYK